MIRVLLSERIIKTAGGLPSEIREKASQAITAVSILHFWHGARQWPEFP
jgi:hypothetical protein